MVDVHEGATKESIEAFAKEHGLTLESVFVPWSQSRNFKKDAKMAACSLNWRVTLKRNGRDVLTCDYSAGIGHAPSYKQSFGHVMTTDEHTKLHHETENGRAWPSLTKNPLKPGFADVLSSLAMDSDVLDSSSFEQWAPELGYDADSRAAEKIYRECLTQALALRNGLGESLLAKLRDAVSGY